MEGRRKGKKSRGPKRFVGYIWEHESGDQQLPDTENWKTSVKTPGVTGLHKAHVQKKIQEDLCKCHIAEAAGEKE